ncbi:BRF1-domain-containing protein [Rhizopogon vinicolor AM-OR11-026]|uniref:B-related factor 1 n=1 Tax=Rhizopogon vinicolor AM-OR11-026 TaxID=1314800 RepID=A0A1B7NJC4_9AGAM|nr:BRF1-domain-containing protein [Rhizopogon vinicolor AM-OR11-026]
MTVCTDCGGTVIEYDAAAGNGFCVKCGTVVEENTIVSEVTFGETSAGAAMVQGSYVGQGSTHARMSGPFGNRGSSESREQTIANASRRIQNFAAVLRLSEVVCLAATRLYTLAVEHKFTKGRKSNNVAAVCLYVACRQKETRNYMLIDFSDLLQVNVFELGHIYLQLVQTLNLKLPLVDPSHYISRFAALLEFGEETHKVATDAVRLVQRFDRDWVTRGRRPAGICGAALLLAARMNNFRRSVEEIVQVVKIADTTLKKRLEEFKKTPSGALTLADFRTVWLDEEMDPPAFTKGKEKEEKEREEALNGPKGSPKKQKMKRKSKRKRRGSESEGEDVETAPPPEEILPQIPMIDPALFNQGILAGTPESAPLFYPDEDEEVYANIDPALRPTSNSISSDLNSPTAAVTEETVDQALAEEVASFLQNNQGSLLSEALDEAEQRRQAQFAEVDELLGLDEDELDRFILTEDEVKIKERVWVEINRDYLEALAAKGEQAETGAHTKSRKRRKTSTRPRDESMPSGSTAAESVRNLIKKNPKYSKRINYDALKDLFVDGRQVVPSLDDKDDLYTMDDKSDGEGMMVLEEGGGGIGSQRSVTTTRLPREEQEEQGDEREDEESEKGDDHVVDIGWEDAYEQEV